MSNPSAEIPVTILTGSLGAGKTTLLNRLLAESDDRSIAVLVNDMGKLNVDVDLIAEQSALTETDDAVAELSNGCICCELRDDLERAVIRLASNYSFDHLIVEPSGISEPAPVSRLFTGGSPAAARYRVDAVVAVVDAYQFSDIVNEASTSADEILKNNSGESADSNQQPLSSLLVEQVEFADVIVINKTDLVNKNRQAYVKRSVETLQPEAKILTTTYSKVDPATILGVNRFDPATAAEQAGWKQILNTADNEESDERVYNSHDSNHGGENANTHTHAHNHSHTHPADKYGISSFSYQRRRPFHPERVAAVMSNLPSSVIRSKGHLWVAGRETAQLTFSQAGPSATISVTGRWIASLPEFEQDMYRNNRSELEFEWDDEWGDRRTGLVFIGYNIDAETLITKLDEAVVTDAEFEDNSSLNGIERFPTDPDDELILAGPTV
ncbi:GTP-binding protein [Haloquadratum walsbyi]|jgi:Putative GTPases (G3E family)|uniref:Putative GTPases (G3E family) n=1 Tax=Haloquadratum walsbyi J07HQW2 TaxID=1238425 RepID=U1PQD2_9EURY|nr:GTP-binding protein [Haloquadratum walsbyi]ERG95962.1 MAG: putative GTPases (G3E family) [Haloquadratum walsbyi J07HQW2]